MSFLIPSITDVMRYFWFSVWLASLSMTIFMSIHFLKSLSTLECLFCSQHHLSRGKAKPFLATISGPVAQPALHCLCGLIPAFPPSVPPVCFLTRSSLLTLQGLSVWCPPPVVAWFIPSSLGVFKYHRAQIPPYLEPLFQSMLPSAPPPMALCLLPLLHLCPECRGPAPVDPGNLKQAWCQWGEICLFWDIKRN